MISLKFCLLPIALLAPAAYAQADQRDDRVEIFWEGGCRIEQTTTRDGDVYERRRCRGDRAARSARSYLDDSTPRREPDERDRARDDVPAEPRPVLQPQVVQVAEPVMPAPRIVAQIPPAAKAVSKPVLKAVPKAVTKVVPKPAPAPRMVAKAAPLAKPVRLLVKAPARPPAKHIAAPAPRIVAKVQKKPHAPRLLAKLEPPPKKPHLVAKIEKKVAHTVLAPEPPVPKMEHVPAPPPEPAPELAQAAPAPRPAKHPKSGWLIIMSPDQEKATAVVNTPLVSFKPSVASHVPVLK